MTVIGFASIITALLFGHGNIIVALYGARILLLHFPLIFIIGRVFSQEDVIKMGKATLWIAIPMTVLITAQFYSPQSAWVNRGVGGDEGGAGFSGALGYFRPPGTFSFTNGNTLFYSFLTPFVFYFAIGNIKVNKLLLIGAALSLFAAIPLSISRALFFQVIISIAFLLIGVSRKPKYLGKMIGAGFGIVILIVLLSNTSFMKTGISAFSARFESANKQEGGLEGVVLDRYLGGMVSAISNGSGMSFFGAGIGIGTKFASFLLTGERRFLMGEGDWSRIIGELGLLMGLSVILLRVGLVVKILKDAYLWLRKGDMLPWMLVSFGFLNVSQGLWAQATGLGFSTLIGGLMLASFRNKPSTIR